MTIAGAVVYAVLVYQHISYDPQTRQPDRTVEMKVLQTSVFLTDQENNELHMLLYAGMGCAVIGVLLRRLSRKLED
jgi:hypothetical protein